MYSVVLLTQVIILIFEVVAAIIGTRYITKYRDDNLSRYLVYFIWFTVFVEVVFGWLPAAIHYLEMFSGLKDTVFNNNLWIYNVYDVISFSFYFFFFYTLFETKKLKSFSFSVLIIFIITTISNLIFSGTFFTSNSSFNSTLGTILILLFIGLYFFQLLQSDKILNFYTSIPFYVSIGALVFHLVINPIFIYQSYYTETISPEFVKIFRIILTAANIFMYTCYIVGFIVCSKKNKFYS